MTEISALARTLGISESSLRKHYGRRAVTVPNGRVVKGKIVGQSAVTLLEHALRDELAAQVGGVTEPTLGYGRADVLTATTVFEVEPCRAWRHAVRQAIQYAAQTGCVPAIALFGAAHRDQVLDIYLRVRDGHPRVELWWYSDFRWWWISGRTSVRSMREPVRRDDAAAREVNPNHEACAEARRLRLGVEGAGEDDAA